MLGHLIACMPPGVGRGLAWFLCIIFKGAINFQLSQGGLLLERNNVNNPRAPGGVLALDYRDYPSSFPGWKGKGSSTVENADRARRGRAKEDQFPGPRV